MPVKSHVRLFLLLLLFLSSVSAASWGVRCHLARQVSVNTQALIKAVAANDDTAVVFLLNHGADPNVRDSGGTTLLGNAVLRNRTGIVIDLLAHGADVNKSTSGETVLFWAATGSNASLVRQLIAHGIDVNAQEDGFHQTALMRAADDTPGGEQSAIVRAILAAHPRLELKDMGGDTAWRIAVKAGNRKIAALLAQAGAVKYSIFPMTLVHQAVYTLTDLGLGQANALNNHGDVVGQVSSGRRDFDGHWFGQAFLWRQGRRQLLNPFRSPFSIANSISDWGKVIGEGVTPSGLSHGDWTMHPFLWQNGVYRDPNSTPNLGSRRGPELHMQDGRIWDSVEPVAVNNKGQSIFQLQASGSERGGIWNGKKLAVLVSPDPSLNNYAYGINDKGAIVGDDDNREALLWTRGKPSVLPGLYHHGEMADQMRAEHINNRGLMVGTVSDDLDARNPEQHAVLWSGGKVTDPNMLVPAACGWMLEDARGINEKGQIAGRGTYRGKEHAFLLTPLTGFKRVY